MTDRSTSPVVSVLMPVRNEEQHVVNAIRSVLAQQVDAEVLVVDGRSTDRTVELVLAIGDPRVRVLDNPKRTIPAALNVGLAEAKGEFVARVDAHAHVSADYLVRGEQALRDDPEVAAIGGLRQGIAETPPGRAIALALSSRFGVGNSLNHYAQEPQDSDHTSFGVYRADVARDVGGWDEALLVNEDVDFDHRIAQRGHRLRFDPQMIIFWQVRENLRDFGRQYRRYGRGKAAMVRKNGRNAVRARHLAAPALVGALGLAAAAAVTGHPRIAATLVAPYVLGVAGATAITSRSDESGDVQPVTLAAAFVTMHLTWGLGFLEGLTLRLPPVSGSVRDPESTTQNPGAANS